MAGLAITTDVGRGRHLLVLREEVSVSDRVGHDR